MGQLGGAWRRPSWTNFPPFRTPRPTSIRMRIGCVSLTALMKPKGPVIATTSSAASRSVCLTDSHAISLSSTSSTGQRAGDVIPVPRSKVRAHELARAVENANQLIDLGFQVLVTGHGEPFELG